MRYGITKYIIATAILAATAATFAGPPISMWNPGELWLAAEYASSHRPLPGNDTYTAGDLTLDSKSNRMLLTGGYKINPYLDAFLTAGFADLAIGSGNPTFNDYSSNLALAIGGGVTAGYYYPEWNLGGNLTGSFLGFRSHAEVANSIRRVENTYHWYEIQLEAVASYPTPTVTPFLGAEKTFLTGIHQVHDYFLDRLQPRPTDSDRFTDPDQSYRPLAGLALHMPGGYSTYVKFSGLQSDDFLFTIGICQGTNAFSASPVSPNR